MGDTALNILLAVFVLAFLAMSFLQRRRRQEGTPLGRVISLLDEVSSNLNAVNSPRGDRPARKLRTGVWKRGRTGIGFLPKELQDSLTGAFSLAEEFNGKINAASGGAGSSPAGPDSSGLKDALAKSKQGLEGWLKENASKPEYAPRHHGLFN